MANSFSSATNFPDEVLPNLVLPYTKGKPFFDLYEIISPLLTGLILKACSGHNTLQAPQPSQAR